MKKLAAIALNILVFALGVVGVFLLVGGLLIVNRSRLEPQATYEFGTTEAATGAALIAAAIILRSLKRRNPN